MSDRVELSCLNFASYNPRIISTEQLERLKKSIKEHTSSISSEECYRLATTVTVNKNGNRIVGGHQRIKALKSLGQDWIHKDDITWVDLKSDSAEEKALNVTLNSEQFTGDWNTSKLDELLIEIKSKDSVLFSNLDLADIEIPEVSKDVFEAPILEVKKSISVPPPPPPIVSNHVVKNELIESSSEVDVPITRSSLLSYTLNAAQRKIVSSAIDKFKNKHACKTTTDAFVDLCNEYVGSNLVIVNEPVITLTFTGDMMFCREMKTTLKRIKKDNDYFFEFCEPHFRAADISFANLETSICEGQRALDDKNYTFNSPVDCLDSIKKAGIDIVSLANNHILDYGENAILQTQKFLTEKGILNIGASDNEQPQTPVIIAKNGISVGFLAYADPESETSYAKNYLDFKVKPAKAEFNVMENDLKNIVDKVDIVVVSMHWGIEYSTEYNDRQVKLGRFLVDNGAKIVVGHHPHVNQGVEVYNDALILYSIGNFIFPQSGLQSGKNYLYKVHVNKFGFVDCSYLPMKCSQYDWKPIPIQDNFETI